MLKNLFKSPSTPVNAVNAGYTLEQTAIPATLQTIRVEFDRLGKIIEGMEMHYEKNKRMDLLDTQRDSVLSPLFSVEAKIDKVANAQFKGDLISLLHTIITEIQSIQHNIQTKLDRIDEQTASAAASAAAAAKVIEAELAEVERIEALFAKHGRVLNLK
jgi:hypothetical protein